LSAHLSSGGYEYNLLRTHITYKYIDAFLSSTSKSPTWPRPLRIPQPKMSPIRAQNVQI